MPYSYSRTRKCVGGVSVISAFPLSPNSSEALEWRFLPDIDSEITTRVAWCQLKHHGEPLSSAKDDEADLDESIDDEVDMMLKKSGRCNFKDFTVVVHKWHQSVWVLKQFTRMNMADPF